MTVLLTTLDGHSHPRFSTLWHDVDDDNKEQPEKDIPIPDPQYLDHSRPFLRNLPAPSHNPGLACFIVVLPEKYRSILNCLLFFRELCLWPISGATTQLASHHLLHLAQTWTWFCLGNDGCCCRWQWLWLFNGCMDFPSILNLNSKLIQKSYMHIQVKAIQVKDQFGEDVLNSRLDTWRRVFAAMTTPGVQKPHWLPACLTNEVW